MSIRSQFSADRSVCNIIVTGQFDISQATCFEDALHEIPPSVDIIRINLKDMLSSDASFLSSILLLREKNPSTIIELYNCSKTLVRRFNMAGVDRLVRLRLASDGHQEDDIISGKNETDADRGSHEGTSD